MNVTLRKEEKSMGKWGNLKIMLVLGHPEYYPKCNCKKGALIGEECCLSKCRIQPSRPLDKCKMGALISETVRCIRLLYVIFKRVLMPISIWFLAND